MAVFVLEIQTKQDISQTHVNCDFNINLDILILKNCGKIRIKFTICQPFLSVQFNSIVYPYYSAVITTIHL